MPIFTKQVVHLFSDNSMAVAIFQAAKGKDIFIQSCAREIWLICASWDVTMGVGHIPGASISHTVDALSCWRMGQSYKDNIEALLLDNDISCIYVPDELFQLFNDL